MKEINNQIQKALTHDASADYGQFTVVDMRKGRLVLLPVMPKVTENILPLTFEQAVANGERARQGIVQEPENYGQQLGSIVIY